MPRWYLAGHTHQGEDVVGWGKGKATAAPEQPSGGAGANSTLATLTAGLSPALPLYSTKKGSNHGQVQLLQTQAVYTRFEETNRSRAMVPGWLSRPNT